VPVTLNPPPFPTPDNTKVASADKTGDANDASPDTFATLLHAAGSSGRKSGATAGSGTAPDASGATASDQLLSPRGVAHGLRGKVPVFTLPVVGSDGLSPAALGKLDGQPGIALARASDADKTDGDKADGDKTKDAATSAVTDLAGMSAALSALLTPGAVTARSAGNNAADADTGIAAAGTAGAGRVGGKVGIDIASAATATKAGANQNALLAGVDTAKADATAVGARARTERDTAAARDDAAAFDAQWSAAPAAVASPALVASAARDMDAALKIDATKSEAVDAAGSTQPGATLQHAVSAQRSDPITIATPVTSPGWQGEFADKLGQVVMTGNDRAEFQLHPANMGPVEVKINVNGDQASVVITAPHAATRDALEQALPQLRDLLANQGITLGQANVQSEHRPSDPSPQPRGSASSPDVPAAVETSARIVRLNGLVDVFA
jgi:flagellar hook-length control protein FliK